MTLHRTWIARRRIRKVRNHIVRGDMLIRESLTGALDQTIVAVALPRLVEEIGGANLYNWVGSAYLLMAACLAPRE